MGTAGFTTRKIGDAGDNPIQGTWGNDYISGGGGRDDIKGGGGNDYIAAGSGLDYWVLGGAGTDTFEFKPGDQAIQIGDWQNGDDKIKLAGGLTYGDLTRSISSWDGKTIVNYHTDQGDRLSFFDVNPNDIGREDFIGQGGRVQVSMQSATSNASYASSTSYASRKFGDGGDNPIQGTGGNDYISGGGGRDDIKGGGGNDYIAAGSGLDYWVLGGSGADTFEFKRGDQAIQIGDWQNGVDKIKLAGGLSYDDLSRSTGSWEGNTLVTYRTDTGDSLTFFNVNPNEIEQFDFI